MNATELLPIIAPETASNRRERIAAFEKTTGTIIVHTINVPHGAEQKIVLDVSEPGIHFFDISQDAESHLTLQYLETGVTATDRTIVVRAKLYSNAILTSWTSFFGIPKITFFQETQLIGAGSSTEQRTLFFAENDEVFDIFSSTIARGTNTSAKIIARGIGTGKSKVRFDGGISIEQTALGAQGHLFEHTLLLSPDAQMNAIPALTIGTNEVVASHSASVTRIDDEHLLYCMCRGIDEKAATRMIAEGFLMAEVPEELRDTIQPLLEKKLCSL